MIRLRGFAGEIPATEAFYLPESAAASVLNASNQTGSLTPLRGATMQEYLFGADRLSIYLHGSTWLGWDHETDAAPGPVATDRLYITHDNGPPTMRANGTEMPLRIPAPTTAPSIALNGTLDTAQAEQICYVYTWVSSLGEESQPSPLSNFIMWSPGSTVTLSSMPVTPPVANRLISGKRVYRALTSESGATDLYFVAQIAATAATYTHNLATAPIADAITTKDFDPPPDNLRGLTVLPNGMMAGFAGKELYFSEPFQPHAWPLKYNQTLNDTIIGLVAFGTTLAVLTTGLPMIIQGMHPEQMASAKMEQPFPCVSKAGIVDMGYSAVYPSTDGLVAVSEGSAQLISGKIWTRQQWQALQPTTIRAARFGRFYGFTFTPPTGDPQLLLIDPAQPDAGLLRSDEVMTAMYTHLESGKTFFLAANRRTVRAFDDPGVAKKSYTWRSKPFRLPTEVCPGAIRVDTNAADGGTVEVKVYGGGQLLRTLTTPNSNERMPGGQAYTDWQVEISGTATVINLAIARTFLELAG